MKIRAVILISFALWAMLASCHAIRLTRQAVAHSIRYSCEETHDPEDCPPINQD